MHTPTDAHTSLAFARRMALLLCVAVPVLLPAQSITVRVVDSTAAPVSFATVQIVNRLGRVADVEGRVEFGVAAEDSLRFAARRLGFRPFIGWVVHDDGEYTIVLAPVATRTGEVRIVATRDTPLSRTGFYDRIERVQRGAYSARFWTPEDLDQRNPTRVSQVLQGESMVRLQQYNASGRPGRILLRGRGLRCGMTVLLDGRRVAGMLEEILEKGGDPATLTSVDELIPASSVAAIEMYGSAAAAPIELQQAAGGVGCGIVAIWTGSRR